MKYCSLQRRRMMLGVKRLIDIFVTATILLASLPLLLVLYMLVRVFLGSPVFFRQTRPGLNAAPFRMVKFRTMIDARDSNGDLLPDDQRITVFGKFLRG